ncbi:TPA: DUF3800 domain-containing protein [Legionella pneumophila]|nr:DUF3800 domain-containing protein [Legionella pneumophila]
MTLMYIIYFDEVKNRPNKHKDFLLGALAIPMEKAIAIEKEVNDLSFDVFGSSLLSKDTEFHGHPLLCGKGLFVNFDDSKRTEIYKRLLTIIDSFEQILKIYIRVNSDKYYGSSLKINEMAFVFLVEKANELMGAEKTLGLLIGDYDDPVIDLSVKQLSEYKDSGTPFKSKNISNLVDTVHYAKSHHSRFIQLADIYVHSLKLRFNPQTQPISLEIQKFTQDLKNNFPNKYKHWPPED